MTNKNGELSLEVSIDNVVDKITDEMALARIAKKLIDLEKDLSLPGMSAVSDSARIERIMDQIEKEKF